MMRSIRKIFLVGVFLFGVMYSAEAQFLDRLKKKVINEAEKVVIDKTADKAAEQTGAAMDKILSSDLGISNIFGEIGSPMDTNLLPEVYRFDYLYSLKMTNEAGELQFDYLLNKKEPYIAMKPSISADITMVIDEANSAIVTVTGGQVFAMKMTDDAEEAQDSDIEKEMLESLEGYKITQLPNRTFLGYECIGYRMENEEHLLTIYLAPDIDAGFDNLFKKKQANIPPKMQSIARHYENGLMMYMEMEDKKNKGGKEDVSATMECVAFEKKDAEIRTR